MGTDKSLGEQQTSLELADDSIRLQPADPVATETRKQMGYRLFLSPVESTELPAAKLPRQFSTRSILLFTAVVAIASTLIQQVELGVLAGICGVVAVAYLGILCWGAVRHPIAWAVLWLLLACYTMLAMLGVGS